MLSSSDSVDLEERVGSGLLDAGVSGMAVSSPAAIGRIGSLMRHRAGVVLSSPALRMFRAMFQCCSATGEQHRTTLANTPTPSKPAVAMKFQQLWLEQLHLQSLVRSYSMPSKQILSHTAN